MTTELQIPDLKMPELDSYIDFKWVTQPKLGGGTFTYLSVAKTYYIDIVNTSILVKKLNIPTPFKELLLGDLDKYNFTKIIADIIETTVRQYTERDSDTVRFGHESGIRFNVLTGEFMFILDRTSENIFNDYRAICETVCMLTGEDPAIYTRTIATSNKLLNEWMQKHICTLGN